MVVSSATHQQHPSAEKISFVKEKRNYTHSLATIAYLAEFGPTPEFTYFQISGYLWPPHVDVNADVGSGGGLQNRTRREEASTIALRCFRAVHE